MLCINEPIGEIEMGALKIKTSNFFLYSLYSNYSFPFLIIKN